MKWVILALALLLLLPGLAQAQQSPARKKEALVIVYDNVTDGSTATDRAAEKAYVDTLRIIEITEKEGFKPARLKGEPRAFKDPRSMRDWAVRGKITLLFVVTADGRVIEPRVLQSTDQRVSDLALKNIIYERFIPARLRGLPVSSLYGEEIAFRGYKSQGNGIGQNGLGIQGYRDR